MKRTIHNPVLRDTVTFTSTSGESGGEFTELEATVMPGGGNLPHFHKSFDETVTIVEGVLTLVFNRSDELELSAGQSYAIRAGLVHSFRNATESVVRVYDRITPGSEGFENALRIMYGLAGDGLYNERKMPRSVQHFAICASISDTRLPGFMSVFNPLIDLLARLARWRGIEDQLRRKYCV